MKRALVFVAVTAAASLRALDPACLGVGFVPASEAQPALDTTTRLKVADAWVYPIVAPSQTEIQSATETKKMAYIRKISGVWKIVAVSIDYNTTEWSRLQALCKKLRQGAETSSVDANEKQTTLQCHYPDDIRLVATLQKVSEETPFDPGTFRFCLVAFNTKNVSPSILEILGQSTGELSTKETQASTPSPTSFLGIPFGKTTMQLRRKLRRPGWGHTDPLMRDGIYEFTPSSEKVLNATFNATFYAHTNKKGEVYLIEAKEYHNFGVPRFDLSDAMSAVSRIGSAIDALHPSFAKNKRDYSDDVDHPSIYYNLPNFTVDIRASLNEDYYWEIHLEARSKIYKDEFGR